MEFKNRSKGFTLVKIAIATAMLGLLVVIAIPHMPKVNEDLNKPIVFEKQFSAEDKAESHSKENVVSVRNLGKHSIKMVVWEVDSGGGEAT